MSLDARSAPFEDLNKRRMRVMDDEVPAAAGGVQTFESGRD